MKLRTILIGFALWMLSPSAGVSQGLGLGTQETPVNDWPLADADSLGLDRSVLDEHAALCEASGSVACLVAVDGFIVQEWKRPDYDYGPFIGVASATKSVTSLLVGMMVGDGFISSIDDRVAEYLPEWKAGRDSSVTIRHLLTMSSGLGRLRPYESMLVAKNATAFVLGLDLSHSPGERWIYSNEGVQLLSPLMEAAAGMPVATYARERLFDPLGLNRTRFLVDEYLNTVTPGGLETTLRDFARLGQLVANEGSWNGRQIVPSEWIRALNEPSAQNPGYSLLWWRSASEGDAVWAAGDGDRILLIIPEHNLVAVRLQRIATMPGAADTTYFNDRGRMHARALDILRDLVPDTEQD